MLRRPTGGGGPVRTMFRNDADAYNQAHTTYLLRNRPLNLVILDRDGAVNQALPHHVRSPEEWQPIPGSLDAVARLGRAGYRVVVATHQPGIRRRYFTFEDLNRIHERMHRRLADYGGTIDAVFVCLCLRSHACECAKPRPSILHEISDRLRVPFDGVPCIGGTPAVLEAARGSGARPMLLRTGRSEAAARDGATPDGIEVHNDLASAVDTLLAED